MKALFSLLLIANFALIFYIQFSANPGGDKILRPEFKPEKIRLLSKDTDCHKSGDHTCFDQKEVLVSNPKAGL
tara:strand:- start:5764 stop:5982 length:219 start_codon:yes stop_codon:yes gene_type:complete